MHRAPSLDLEAAQRAGAIVVVALVLGAGCHLEKCEAPTYDEGDRFRITVLARRSNSPPCDAVPLAVGASFELTAGGIVHDSQGCGVRVAQPDVPSFASGVLTSCTNGLDASLSMVCTGRTMANCGVRASIIVGVKIARSQTSVDDGILNIDWGSECFTGNLCSDSYDVRIERLPPGAP
jgi:hypothetical protein